MKHAFHVCLELTLLIEKMFQSSISRPLFCVTPRGVTLRKDLCFQHRISASKMSDLNKGTSDQKWRDLLSAEEVRFGYFEEDDLCFL